MARPMELMERTLSELERTRRIRITGINDSKEEIKRRTDIEMTIREHALSQQRRHLNGNDKEGN